MSDALSRSFRDVDVETGIANGKLMAYLAARGEVLSRRYEGDRAILHCRIPQKYLGRINDPDVVISLRGATIDSHGVDANGVEANGDPGQPVPLSSTEQRHARYGVEDATYSGTPDASPEEPVADDTAREDVA